MDWVRCRICATRQCSNARTGARLWRSECELYELRMVFGITRFIILAMNYSENLGIRIANWCKARIAQLPTNSIILSRYPPQESSRYGENLP